MAFESGEMDGKIGGIVIRLAYGLFWIAGIVLLVFGAHSGDLQSLVEVSGCRAADDICRI